MMITSDRNNRFSLCNAKRKELKIQDMACTFTDGGDIKALAKQKTGGYKLSKSMKTKKEIDTNGHGENSQDSSQTNEKNHILKPIVPFGERHKHPPLATRSIHKTKDSTIPQNMIDSVNEELCLQRADSPFFEKALELELTAPPSFMSSEVELAGSLGKGAFCKIYEVNQFNIPDNVPGIRGFMKNHCLRNGEARYAIKLIQSQSELVRQEEVTDAAIDLAREAEFLAALKHPNIIRIHGTVNVPGHPEYSLILDRLCDTLDVQMKKWRVDKKRNKGKFKGLIGKNKKILNKMWMDRLIISYDVACAMAYLHSRGILHRDIKPTNIGFDIRGDVKIFDFGLSKELKPSEREGEGKYRIDDLAGTRRYMAPEVAQAKPHGFSSDVYSFGILIWEMMSLKKAFERYTCDKHYKNVVVEGNRPKVSKSWPFVIKNLLERCWHKVPSERPTFQAVCELIELALWDDNVDLRERSDDLMLRSVRSHHGRVDSHHVDDSEPGLKDQSMNGHLESYRPSDSLLYIGITIPRLGMHRNLGCKVLPIQKRLETRGLPPYESNDDDLPSSL